LLQRVPAQGKEVQSTFLCGVFQTLITTGKIFTAKIMITDEDNLYLSGHIKRQNIRILGATIHIYLLQVQGVQGTVPISVHVFVLYQKIVSGVYFLPKSL
jgi:hypothetical protein